MFDIIGVGDTNIDLLIKVDHIPQHDEKIRGTLLGRFPGGIMGNFCSAAAKFGSKVGIVTKLGHDEFGDICKQDFVQRGVDIGGLNQDMGVDTYFCVVHLDHTGEKALTIVETSGFLPKKSEIDFSYLTKARYIHMTTLDVSLANYVFSHLRQFDCQLSLDIEKTASRVSDNVWESLLSKVDIAFPNQSGLATLTGAQDIEKGARILLELGVKNVVVTCGADGVRIFREDISFSYPAFKVNVLDTTGAGDCFNAVFVSCLSFKQDLFTSAKYASAAAAISIQSVGAREGLPSRGDVEKFLKVRGAL